MPYIDRNGTKIYYETTGEGSAVLLTHGYSSTLRTWDPQVAVLGDRFQLIAWDIRGHGSSDCPEDPGEYSIEATVADMAAILDACGAERAVLAGHSMGGFLSLEFHLVHRERVAALVLYGTGPGFKKDKPRAGWNELAERTATRLEEKGFAALGKGAEVAGSKHRSPQGLANAARGIMRQKDARVIESLPTIEVPTLVLAGANDEPFLASTDYMAVKVANATKVLIDDAGHSANKERPEAFNAALAAFLEKLPDF